MVLVAYNIHVGGGKTLLLSLLNSLPKNIEVFLFADLRIEGSVSNRNLNVKYVRNNIFSRFMAELNILLLSRKNDITLMFGGLPPIFRNKSQIYLFIQNLNNITNSPLKNYSLVIRMRIVLERIWLRIFLTHVQKIIVQTDSVKNVLVSKKIKKSQILVLPFAERIGVSTQDLPSEIKSKIEPNSSTFIYPASFEPHKNHITLIKAWEILFDDGVFPMLFLTLDSSDFETLVDLFPGFQKMNIINLGPLSHDLLLALYKRCSGLVFPSKYESFGLPLVEAAQLNLPIIAPELDYVRDVCIPSVTFDASSSLSLARSVKRFMGVAEAPLVIRQPRDFLDYLLNDQ